MTSNESPFVYISLGSNIEPSANLARAVKLLSEKCAMKAVSSTYRTAPQGFRQQADFLNMAVKLTTSLDAVTLKREVLDWIESELGRVRDPNNKNAPRTIDLDIALWGDDILDYGDKPWHIPDPDITRFAHVAVPLAELAPDYIHPELGITLVDIASRLDSSEIKRVDT
jgi:2-amino-4-hydroxy-6-hydroxymethyldihydropteridine diphosphokinase